MKMAKSKLDLAIDAFEDPNSKQTLGERISGLRSALMFSSFEALKGERAGKKGKEWEDECVVRTECMKHFQQMEKLYAAQLKLNKLAGATTDKIDNDFLSVIRQMKSSVGDLVQDLSGR